MSGQKTGGQETLETLERQALVSCRDLRLDRLFFSGAEAMDFRGSRVTWLGHATFLLTTPAGKTVLIDPWLESNPLCPKSFHEVASDAILITHGHFDHTGDAVKAATRCSGNIVGIYELTEWLAQEGVASEKLVGIGKGGTYELVGLEVSVTLTDAKHSSSATGKDGSIIYLGEPAGFVVAMPGGLTLYVAGDTCLFGDMEWIKTLYQPRLALLPIGGHYTMDPKAAAYACKLLGVEAVIPCHYGTFPVLKGTPDQLRSELNALGLSTEVIVLEPGWSTP
jgi:L-ascorbate metabolism protein UlaG (beta-lactamase superfamily)